MNKLYLWSKIIHRILVISIVLLSLVMMTTGLLIKNFRIAAALQIDVTAVRYVHNSMSTFFSIALVCMVTTGLIMYLTLLLKRKKTTV